MNDDTYSPAGGAGKHRLLPSRSRHLSVRLFTTCAGAVLALHGVAPVHALSGFPDTGQVAFFNDPDEATQAKFYCDWRFDPDVSPSLPACAQHDPGFVAVQVGTEGFVLGVESGVTISSTAFGLITTSTKDVGEFSSARAALICETAGDNTGLEYCLEITEGGGGGPSACPAKFTSVTANASECAADLVKLQDVFGPTAHIDFTKDRNNDGTLNINVCTPANWVCVDPPLSLTGLGNREIQQLGSAVVDTPITCTIGGKTYRYATPPVSKCP